MVFRNRGGRESVSGKAGNTLSQTGPTPIGSAAWKGHARHSELIARATDEFADISIQ